VGAIAYAHSFSPWITYGAVSASLTWRAGVYAALIVQVALAASLSRRRELDALSIGTLAFFGAMSGVALASPHAAIHRWIAALSAGALAVIALASLAVGQPFTLAIARRSTPAELWEPPRVHPPQPIHNVGLDGRLPSRGRRLLAGDRAAPG